MDLAIGIVGGLGDFTGRIDDRCRAVGVIVKVGHRLRPVGAGLRHGVQHAVVVIRVGRDLATQLPGAGPLDRLWPVGVVVARVTVAVGTLLSAL